MSYLRYVSLLLLFFLSGCFSLKDLSDNTVPLFKREAALYEELRNFSELLEKTTVKNPERLFLLNESAKALREYLNVLQVIDDKLSSLKRVSEEDINKALRETSPEIKASWEKELKPLIRNFLTRDSNLEITLSSWELEDIQEWSQDLALLSRNENTFQIKIPEERLTRLLSLFFPHDNLNVEKLSAFTLIQDKAYLNTQGLCQKTIRETLQNKYCLQDALVGCSPQINLACVSEVAIVFKKADCRERKTSAYYSETGILTTRAKLKDSLTAYSLRESLGKCRSGDPITTE